MMMTGLPSVVVLRNQAGANAAEPYETHGRQYRRLYDVMT